MSTRRHRLLERMLAPGPRRPVIRLGQSGQSGINEPSFVSGPSELRLGPQRSTPPAPSNVEAGSSRGAQRTQLSDSESGGFRPINLLDINLNEPPPTDNNEPEGGPSSQQYIRLPVFRFELPPGHRAPGPTDAEELDDFDVVYFRNYDRASVLLPRDLDHEPQGGSTSHLAQGRQPVAPVEQSLRPLRSPESRPIDMPGLYDDGVDENNEDNSDVEPEIVGPPNPMALVGQPAIHHAPVAQVEQSIHPQGSPPHGSIDVVELDSEDEHEDNDEDNDDDVDDNDDDNDDDDDGEDDRNEDTYDGELERGPTNPMARVGQPAIQHALGFPVVQSILLQRSAPPIDVVQLDSDDEHEDNDEDQDNGDDGNEDDDDDDDDHHHHEEDDHEEEEEEEEDDDVAAGDKDVIISSPIAFGQGSSSRTAQGRTSLVDSESLQIADNNESNKRRRVDSQPPVHIRDFNVHLVGTSSSMPEPAAHPALPPLASTSICPVCMGPLGATSSMPMLVAPPPPPPPPPPPQLPTFNCPICMEPLVEPTATRCGHLFCQSCIRTSVAAQARCPICRCRVSHRELNRIYFPTRN